MKDQLGIQKLLGSHLGQAQVRNPQYSLRSFASKLGIGAGPLSQILSGKRRVSRRMAEQFCDRLLLDPAERSGVLQAFDRSPSPVPAGAIPDEENHLKLTADQFKVVSDWHHFALLSLIKTKGFRPEPFYISRRLGISRQEAALAFQRLIRLGMIEERGSKWVHTRSRYRTSDDVANTSLKKAHHQTLELARASLERDPVEARDFTTMTMPTHPEKLREAKELIRKFQNELCTLLMDTQTPTEVYRLSVELFPLTKQETNE